MTDSINSSICMKIGVTAHRNLQHADQDKIRQQVRELFENLRSEFPDLPLVLLNPLAEGGDMLVARVALEMGIALEIPLPMPLEVYEQDFQDPAVLAEFRSLLAQGESFELPLAEGNSLESIQEHSPARTRQYAQLGMYISGHSHFLMALWDGEESDKPGGTASVVHFQLQDVMPGLPSAEEAKHLLADKESDLVYHIHCPRNTDAPPQAAGRWLNHATEYPGPKIPTQYHSAFAQMLVFRGDIARHKRPIGKSTDTLITDPNMLQDPGLLRIDKVYRAADWLAIHYRKRVVQELMLTHVLAAMMGFSFITYSEYQEFSFLLPAFLGFFLTAWIFTKVANFLQWHRKYLDYRALAEGLRVQFYWCLADVEEFHGTAFTYDNLMQKQDVELVWIRHIMRSVSTAGRAHTHKIDDGLALSIEHWIGEEHGTSGQLGYYGQAAAQRSVKLLRNAFYGRVTLWLGISIAVSLLLAADRFAETPTNILFILMGLLPLLAGIREAYAYKKADKELTKQYQFMQKTFSKARKMLDQNSDRAVQESIMRALGETCLEEHSEWILLHRERPLEHSGLAA